MRTARRDESKTVAVDANPATRAVHTGTEVFARELVRRLPALAPDIEWVLYASRPAELDLVPLTVLPQRRLWSQLRLPVELARRRPDLFFAPSHVIPFLAPGRALTVIHDLAFERFPDIYRPAARHYLRLTTRWAAVRCPLLITVSEATRRDLAELYDVEPARVRVVPPGCLPPAPPAPEPRLAELGVSPPYALHVGRIEARKNQLVALAAVRRVAGLSLVCAGPVADPDLAESLRAGGAIVLGRVSPPDLERLYASAAALVFPSLYEGFGLPVLEAMARGLPVVTVRGSSLEEAGGQAALYAADPWDVDGLAGALRAVVEDSRLRDRLAAAGREQAGRFSWERTARGVLAVIRELLAR